MIQVYSQISDSTPVEQKRYYISKNIFWGITFDIKNNPDSGITVNLNGTSSVDSTYETYINLTWPMELSEIGDFLRMETDLESDGKNVYFGISYQKQETTQKVYFNDGETVHDFIIPSGARQIRAVAYVKGKNTVNCSFKVQVKYGRKPASKEGDFLEHNGNMTLLPTSASTHAVLNGTWEASLEHPIDPEGRWKYLVEDALVKMPSFNGEQLFRIKQREKSDSGVTCEMEPVFYDAMGDCWLTDVRPTKKNGQEALNMMLASNKKYSGSSNITRASTAYYQYKNFLEALNGEDENSFINRWGGEILFDNFKVSVNERVGGDYGVELRYGKNISKDGLSEEIDVRDVVTRIYPKAYNGYTMTDNGYVDSPLIRKYPTVRSATITFDDVKMAEDAMEDDAEKGVIICKNQAELDRALKKRCQEQYVAGLDKPTVTIEADMILLQNTDLYKDYKILETVGFGDTIHCRHSRLEITTDARVIELEYDSIRKKVKSVVLGDFQYNFFNNVSSSINRIDGAIRPDGSLIAEKIAGFINGAMASLRAQYNVAKKQDVMAILFENKDKKSLLYGAMAMGTQGLMISNRRTKDGRDWDWTTALTANGLMAGIIIAGIISDKTGENWWDLDKGVIHIESGIFAGELKAAKGTFSGELSSVTGNIAGWEITKNGLQKGGMHIYSSGSINDEDFTDGTTNIYPDGISTQKICAAELHQIPSYSGEIPIITGIEKTANGGIQWYHSTITVEDGIVRRAPKP